MFANLQNPMFYIIAFQMGVLLVPACAALVRYLSEERRGDIRALTTDTNGVIYLGDGSSSAWPRAA